MFVESRVKTLKERNRCCHLSARKTRREINVSQVVLPFCNVSASSEPICDGLGYIGKEENPDPG